MHWHGRARRFFELEFVVRPGQRRVGARGRGSGGLLGLGLGLGAAALGGGCGLSTKEAGGTAEALKKPELACVRAGADRVEASSFRLGGQGPGSGPSNGQNNAKNDIVKVFMRSPEAGGGVTLLCKELDLNGDGRKDMLVYYDGHGRKLREEFDHDFDGLADMKSYYELGQLVRQELDVDFDGKPDLVEHFENGKRVRLEKFLALPPAVTPPSKAEAPASGEPAAAASERSSGPAAGERSGGPAASERSGGPAASEPTGGPAGTSPQAPARSPDPASGLPPAGGR